MNRNRNVDIFRAVALLLVMSFAVIPLDDTNDAVMSLQRHVINELRECYQGIAEAEGIYGVRCA